MIKIHLDSTWALFLDRDGVINERLPDDYVKTWSGFRFLPNSLEAIADLSYLFGRIVVVTNQAGIGKGLMTEGDLYHIHQRMIKEITAHGGRIDAVYFAPDHPKAASINRKPQIGMALQAQKDFPEIEFSKSIMVGDSLSDMQFGRRAGMVCVFITGKGETPSVGEADFIFPDLWQLSQALSQIVKKL